MKKDSSRLLSKRYWQKKFRKEHAKRCYRRELALSRHGKFMHYLFGLDLPEVVTCCDQPNVSADLMGRMADMYKATRHLFEEEQGTLWGELKSTKGKFLSALENKDIDELKSQIGNLLKYDLTEGMSHSEELTDDSKHSYCKNYFALRSVDLLLSLAEAIGCSRVQNQEQVPILEAYEYINQDREVLLSRIEDKLGFSIEVPKFGNAPAILVGKKRLSPDSIMHAYTAYRLKELGATNDSVVLEIGGGHGSAAMMSHLAGIEDYTIIDLPYVNAFQFGFLGSVLGDDIVKGYGEFNHAKESVKGIKFLSTRAIKDLPDNSVDFVINSDSLPEIPYAVAQDYIHEIKRICRGKFLSLNQETGRPHPNGEAQCYVPELVKNTGALKRISRSLFWMRQGYVDEVYDCSAKVYHSP